MRLTRTSSDRSAGCFTCNGSNPMWTGKNAQALAARHHDKHQHQTWCDVHLSIVYGAAQADPRQTDIEDAIAERAA